jgi:hypothetical protein
LRMGAAGSNFVRGHWLISSMEKAIVQEWINGLVQVHTLCESLSTQFEWRLRQLVNGFWSRSAFAPLSSIRTVISLSLSNHYIHPYPLNLLLGEYFAFVCLTRVRLVFLNGAPTQSSHPQPGLHM